MEKFWQNKRVLITGNTGFKGTWLNIWLNKLGAKVFGYAKEPLASPNLYNLCTMAKKTETCIGDIRDFEKLNGFIKKIEPEIVFHLAAQPLVRQSYRFPLETYEVNVLGTAYLLESIRCVGSVKSMVNITTDKCYENKEWCWGYREDEKLGGFDPYSSSKACSEIITAAYRQSFFEKQENLTVNIATARAGNVIGGGDWSEDRLLPDCIRSIFKKQKIVLRNPQRL